MNLKKDVNKLRKQMKSVEEKRLSNIETIRNDIKIDFICIQVSITDNQKLLKLYLEDCLKVLYHVKDIPFTQLLIDQST